MSKRLLALALGGGATFLGVYLLSNKPTYLAHSLNSDPKTIRAANSGDGLIGQEVADLRRELASLRANQIAQANRPGSPSEKFRKADITPEESREADERELRQYRQNLEDALHGQYRDVKWAGDTERKVENALVNYAPATTLDSAICAASLCKVVVKHTDDVTRKEFLQTIGNAVPFTGGTFYSYDGMITTMYVSKEGERFPTK